jgi:hypothetical protein
MSLRARTGGVLVGRTDGGGDELARIAGLIRGVICEIMNDDGRWAGCRAKFAKRHRLLVITVADLIRPACVTRRWCAASRECVLPPRTAFRVFAFEPHDRRHISLVIETSATGRTCWCGSIRGA